MMQPPSVSTTPSAESREDDFFLPLETPPRDASVPTPTAAILDRPNDKLPRARFSRHYSMPIAIAALSILVVSLATFWLTWRSRASMDGREDFTIAPEKTSEGRAAGSNSVLQNPPVGNFLGVNAQVQETKETADKIVDSKKGGTLPPVPQTPIKAVAKAKEEPPARMPDPFAGTRAGEIRDDNSLQLRLVWCPPGRFTMGSQMNEKDRRDNEGPVEVTLTNGFWLGQTEVTQGQWQHVMHTKPWSEWTEFVKQGSGYPATYVTRDDAMAFCETLTAEEHRAGRLPAVWRYILPTEAQWEYACRAGTTTRFSFGDDDSHVSDYAWSHSWRPSFAHEVGQKRPNPWGLYDMHGNVCEWCRDIYVKELPGGTDPELTFERWAQFQPYGNEAAIESFSVCRGHYGHFSRSASRSPGNGGNPDYGFRVAAVVVVPRIDASIAGAKHEEKPEPTPDVFAGTHVGQVRDDNELKMQLVWCPQGRFTMGSPTNERDRNDDEGPVQVTLTNGFWLGQTEVTQGQWENVMHTKPWSIQSGIKEREDFAATLVDWQRAMAFCARLTERERRAGRLMDWKYTLPTEAEWEYACRAGTTSRFSCGDSEFNLQEYAWIGIPLDASQGTYPVAAKKPNPWGLFDMHGNAWEWCRDVYMKILPGGTDPEVTCAEAKTSSAAHLFTTTGNPLFPVCRGGNWGMGAKDSRSACRFGRFPGQMLLFAGFRVALEPPNNTQAHTPTKSASTPARRPPRNRTKR
jgi:formylglycine-generating enzyme required for sulfatase activity